MDFLDPLGFRSLCWQEWEGKIRRWAHTQYREAPGVIPPVFPALHIWHCPQAPPFPTHLSAVNAAMKQETAMVLSWIRLTMEILKRTV